MDLEPLITAGLQATLRGAEVLRDFFGRRGLAIRKKGAIDLVTEADTQAEKQIIETLRARFPDHGIHAEESGYAATDSDYCWIVDPLDGTTNFAHGVPLFGVSVALTHHARPLLGFVLNPITRELFSAVRDQGAFLNGRSIQVSATRNIRDSLLVTGFPYNLEQHLEPLLQRFKNCLRAAQGIRRLGSAALDLCYTACGRFDGFWEQHLNPWDTAAGSLIAAEAGALVTDFRGRPFDLRMPQILATAPHLQADMIRLLTLQKEGT